MTYVISDIHNCMDMFHEMLSKINFSEEDKLYVLGDVIDKNKGNGIQLLQFIKESPNIELIIGNHEGMMLEGLLSDDPAQMQRWMRNGGQSTLEAFLTLSPDEQSELLNWLKNRPINLQVEVGSNKFFLVHGWIGNSPKEYLWGRPDCDIECPVPGQTLIVGHTPVFHLYKSEFEDDELQVYYGKGFVDIDCGCGHLWATGCLACLRLDDMAEFYVK